MAKLIGEGWVAKRVASVEGLAAKLQRDGVVRRMDG